LGSVTQTLKPISRIKIKERIKNIPKLEQKLISYSYAKRLISYSYAKMTR
jgi:hypothetical protein